MMWASNQNNPDGFLLDSYEIGRWKIDLPVISVKNSSMRLKNRILLWLSLSFYFPHSLHFPISWVCVVFWTRAKDMPRKNHLLLDLFFKWVFLVYISPFVANKQSVHSIMGLLERRMRQLREKRRRKVVEVDNLINTILETGVIILSFKKARRGILSNSHSHDYRHNTSNSRQFYDSLCKRKLYHGC